MQTLKPKPAAAVAVQARHDRARCLGITDREYVSLGKLSNALDPLGVKTTGITKGFLGVGCVLKLSSGNHDYEVLVSNGRMLLGKVETSGQRIKLSEGSTSTESSWSMLLRTIENSEGRL